MLAERIAMMEKRLLIVDDAVQITSLLTDVFTNCGAAVTSVNAARDAMNHLQTTRYDLVILDLIMPDMDGWDVLRFMRAVQPELLSRTILLTGDRYRSRTRNCILGVEMPVLFKPFALEDLRRQACQTMGVRNATPAA